MKRDEETLKNGMGCLTGIANAFAGLA